MANLIGMIALTLATIALWFTRKQHWVSQRPIAFRTVLIAAYASTLLIALRFGARTYPGVWIGRSRVLNNIFNGSQIFWIGCDFVLVAAVADWLSALLARGPAPTSGIGDRVASITRNVFLLLAALAVIYGFYFAIVLERLPA